MEQPETGSRPDQKHIRSANTIVTQSCFDMDDVLLLAMAESDSENSAGTEPHTGLRIGVTRPDSDAQRVVR